MNVKELILRLNRFDENLEVMMQQLDTSEHCVIDDIEKDGFWLKLKTNLAVTYLE